VLVTIIGIQHRQQLLLLLLVPTETHRSTALSLNGKASPLICGMQVACAAYLPCLNGKASPSICGMQSFCSPTLPTLGFELIVVSVMGVFWLPRP